MNAFVALLRCEFLLRSRRASSLVVLLAVVACAWLMIGDPADGMALVVIDDARMRYDSATLAFGSATLGALLLSLAGFYLARGRVHEDLRSGLAGVLGASPVPDATLLLARAAGALLHLLALAAALLLSVWALHALRGEGPWQPLVYLQSYALVLLPALLLPVACASLADAWAPLLGRRGDVAYFLLWVLLLGLMPAHGDQHQLGAYLLSDLTGVATGVARLSELIGSNAIGIGAGDFDAALALREFPTNFWTPAMVVLRLGCALLALLPLLLALPLFHRWAPERLARLQRGGGRGRLARWGLALLAPLGPLQRGLAAALPRLARWPALGGLLAELLLSLITQRLALLWLLLAWLLPLLAEPGAPDQELELWGLQAGILAGWALWAAEIGARECGPLEASLAGGAWARLAQRFGACWLLGLLGSAGLLLREPAPLLPLAAGLAAASAGALLLGQLAHSARAFLGLFLFWLFVAIQVRQAPWLDLMGFNGLAPAGLVAASLGAAAALLALAAWQLRRS